MATSTIDGERAAKMPPLRFALAPFPWSRFEDPAELVECAVLAEQLGFDAVHVPSHLLVPAWPEAASATKVWFDPVVLATLLTASTARLEVETSVLVLPYYAPVALAKALATLDVVSGGRFRLGVGSGWMKAEFRRLGVAFETRGEMTDEYLRAMRALWTMEHPNFGGRWVSFEDVSFLPRPTRAEGIPIVVGGSGPRPFRRVAELGAGWHPVAGGPTGIERGIAELEPLMAARGRDLAELRVVYDFAAGEDPEMEAMYGHLAEPGGAGTGRAMTPSGEGRRFAPSACIEGVARLAEAGVTDLAIRFAGGDATRLAEELRWFAAEVMPAFS